MDMIVSISELDLDLLTVLGRLFYVRDMIIMSDSTACLLVTADAPRLAGRLAPETVAWLDATDLDDGLVQWVHALRAVA
jgi:hypothetical protein